MLYIPYATSFDDKILVYIKAVAPEFKIKQDGHQDSIRQGEYKVWPERHLEHQACTKENQHRNNDPEHDL
ncbi:hypothetical protein D3C86_2040560 [compost metagenome]